MLKRLSIFIASLSLLSACQDMSKSTSSLTIETEGTEKMRLVKLMPQKEEPLDTLNVEGKHQIDMNIDTGSFYMLALEGNYRLPLYLNPGNEVRIKISKQGESYDYEVKGSEESVRMKRIMDLVAQSEQRIQEMSSQMQGGGQDQKSRENFQAEFEAEVSKVRQELLDMIDARPGMLANMYIWPQSIGRFQLVPAEDYLSYYEKVSEALLKNYPDNPHAHFFSEQMEKIKQQAERSKSMEEANQKLTKGSQAPDFALPDTSGQELSLSDLRGKVVLIDFWAAWCRPCRAENPNLVETYHKYKDEGFTVMSVSLDGLPKQPNSRQSWIRAIENDKLAWPNHVSDLKGWNSSVVELYGFQGIPFTVLVDEEGTIIAKNLRGASLRQKLAEVFES